jgi:branched-chain amino acid transport system permease protein
MIVCGLLNTTIERVAYKPLRGAPRLVPLITAVGVAFILENIAFIWKGPRPVSLPPNTLPNGAVFTLGSCPKCATYRWDQLFVLVVTVLVLIGLVWLVRYTKQGKAMRATAQDKDAAAMMGIDVNRTISFTFLVAGALAGAAGVIFTLYGTTIQFNTGFTLGLIAFTAAVLGGIGNLQGAVLGGLLIGFIQDYNEGLSWHAPGSAWTNTIVFGILILILVFRPQGLLGEQTPEGS